MTEKMRSSVMGLILGQFSSPLPISQKEPVAYLYNGVRLPVLPEWDKTVYPYAAMLTSTDSDIEKLGRVTLAYLVYSTMPLKFKFAFFGGGLIAATDGSAIKYLIGTVGGITDEDWNLDADDDGDYAVGELVQDDVLTVARWSNHDILNEDGSLHLAASEPVPVYE